MKKPIVFSVLFFILTAISSFGQWIGVWVEETVDPNTGLRTGKIEVNGMLHEIKPNVTITNSRLWRADLRNANLREAVLDGARLKQTNLEGANLSGASLRGASLERTSLGGADLEGADLEGANICNIDFRSVKLKGANFSGAKLERIFPFSEEHPLAEFIAAASRGNYNEVQELKLIVKALGQNDISIGEQIGEQLTTLGQNDISIGEQMDILGAQLAQNDIEISRQIDSLGQNDTAIGEQITKLGQNDESIIAEINAMKAQLQTLVAQVAEKDTQIAEKDAKIAELEQGGGGQSLEQVLEQVRDARAGSVVLTVDPEGDTVTLGLTIEQSDNLIEWTKLDGEMTRTIPIPDGKKFYRFALDK